MRLEYYPQEKLEKEIIVILKQHLNLENYKIFFFGSRVSGKGTNRSDIDMGIEGPPIPLHVWSDIREAFENIPILYTIEVVDFNKVSARFREVALEYREDIRNPYVKV